MPEKQSVEKGKTAVAPSLEPVKTGFVFMAWSADYRRAYDFKTPVTHDLTLRARWQAEAQAEYWQVAWELNGGAWSSEVDNHATQVLKGGTLAEHAFAKCWELQSINLPASLETIDKYAFDDCYNLPQEMEIPDKVKEIRQNAFDGSSISTFIMHPTTFDNITYYKIKYYGKQTIGLHAQRA